MNISKLGLYLAVFGILVFCIFGSVSNISGEETIHIASGEYAPWTGSTIKHHGFVNHIITEVFKREGYVVQFTYFPWEKTYELAQSGNFHATSYWYKSEAREALFHYSDPISMERLVFFHLKSTPLKAWNTMADLKEYRIGATAGYTYTKEFWDAANAKQIKVFITDSDRTNFARLLREKIDLFPVTLLTGYTILRHYFDPGIPHVINFHPKPLSKTTGHLLFPKSRKKSETLLPVFNKGLVKLKAEGIYDTLLDNVMAGKYIIKQP